MPHGLRTAIARSEVLVSTCGCGWRAMDSPGHLSRLMQIAERHVLQCGQEVTVVQLTLTRIRGVLAHVPGGGRPAA